jgi:ribonucleotide reductase alpha subunit
MSTSKLTEVKLPAYFYDFELLKQTRLLQVAIEEKEASRPLASFRKAKFLKKNNDFDEYQKFIYISRYSKWSEEQKRRETWPETIRRYLDFLEVRLKKVNNYILSEQLRNQLEKAIHNHEIMPSMRCLMAAGKALDRDNVAGYNCSFLNIDHPRAFDEAMYRQITQSA